LVRVWRTPPSAVSGSSPASPGTPRCLTSSPPTRPQLPKPARPPP